MHTTKEKYAMLAVAGSGLIWGVFWIPLRALNSAGIQGIWAVVLLYLVPFILLIPFYFYRWQFIKVGGVSLNISGLLSGTALVLYAGALIFTEVIHALLLYYLTPLWSTLLARLILSEAITRLRWLAMLLGFAGMVIILGGDTLVPWPNNIGDWMGLAAGILWAFAAVQMKKDDQHSGIEFALSYFFWGSIAALSLTLLPFESSHSLPNLEAIYQILPWFIPLVIVLIIPPSIAVMWGASILSPGTVGLLFMTEISIGAITAAIWAGEPFGLQEIIGVVLITGAGLLEPIKEVISNRLVSGNG